MITNEKTKRISIPITQVVEGDRVRKDYGDLKELAESIRTEGLIHPIVVDLNYNLVAGGRRYRATRDILKAENIEITFIECADQATLRRLEAEENVRRKEMTWQERVRSVRLVHQHQTFQAALKSETWTTTMTGDLLGASKSSVLNLLAVAARLEAKDSEIEKCESMSEALKILIKRKEYEINAALASSSVPTNARTVDITTLLQQPGGNDRFWTGTVSGEGKVVGENIQSTLSTVGLSSRPSTPELPTDLKETPEVVIPLSAMMHKGDAIAFMRSLPPESFDHIITDAPYAIDMDMIQQDGVGLNIDSTRLEHDVQENKILLRDFIRESKRSVRDKGFVITWCDISQWQYLIDIAEEFGLTVQRWPLVWHKTHQCQNGAANYNFTKNFEIALVLRKSNATLLTPGVLATWQGSFELGEKETYGHPFAKPAKLWQWIYSATAQRGQSVLDCFAGSGSSTIAAIRSGLRPISVELTDIHYNRAVCNVTDLYRKLHPKVSFT